MEEREYQTYLSLFSNMSNFMYAVAVSQKCGSLINYRKKPNLIVHLDVSPEESLRRVQARKRECESTLSLDYLQRLHVAYEEFVGDITRIIPVIHVNYETFRTAEEMADMIIRLIS